MACALAGGCGGEDLFISANLDRNADCEFVADASNALENPVYDIAAGATQDSDACADPYVAHLLVRNDNAEEVVVDSAAVVLLSTGLKALVFNQHMPLLPNPFSITVAGRLEPGEGVVAVEAIPEVYGRQLGSFEGERVIARIELRARTSDGDGIASNPFRVPIAICIECRTLCASDPEAQSAGACNGEELGPDRASCIDDGC